MISELIYIIGTFAQCIPFNAFLSGLKKISFY